MFITLSDCFFALQGNTNLIFWICWMQPSTCCGPCPPGSSRQGCSFGSQTLRETGTCVECAAGTHLNATRARYDATCDQCNSSSYSGAGASDCTPFAPCPPGFQRSYNNVTYAGICTACPEGFFKEAGLQDSWDVMCAAIPFCNAGSYRQVFLPINHPALQTET
jgi:hypothetical protein